MRLCRKFRHNLIACFVVPAAFHRATQKDLRCLASAYIFPPPKGRCHTGGGAMAGFLLSETTQFCRPENKGLFSLTTKGRSP